MKKRRFSVALLVLSACATPYSTDISKINYGEDQLSGVIQVSDAKLYSREALVSERKEELQYLDDLLDKSKTITFAPEIIRELEQITVLSAALGLSFDPQAGLAYQRSEETSSIKQEIDVLTLQLQLDRLKRDAELFREQFSQDIAPSSEAIPSAPNAALADPVIAGASAAQLTKAVESISTSLANRFDTSAVGLKPRLTTASVNPSDVFHDRAAYRDLIKGAKNSESLDELHDRDGAALMRFQFSATALPPYKSHLDSLGILRMSVEPPTITKNDVERLYLLWLSYINRNLNIRRDTTYINDDGDIISSFDYYPNPRLVYLSKEEDLFDIIEVELPRNYKSDKCGGYYIIDRNPDECLYINIALPKYQNINRAYTRSALSITSGREGVLTRKINNAQRGLLSEKRKDAGFQIFDQHCNLSSAASIQSQVYGGRDKNTHITIADAIDFAELAVSTTNVAGEVQRVIGELSLVDSQIISPNNTFVRENEQRNVLIQRSEDFLQIASDNRPECNLSGQLSSKLIIKVPNNFLTEATSASKKDIRIYDVAPREKAQQVSTVARAAEAIGLAAAIKGELPSAGIGADGNLAFSQNSTGKADARERAPLVVSFAEAGEEKGSANPAFGWLLGPKATLNPKKNRIELSHKITPYETSVDLSLPGWWPYVSFETASAWSPNWQNVAATTMDMSSLPKTKTYKVNLQPNAADMAGLTNLLIKKYSPVARSLYPSITNVTPSIISACQMDSTLLVTGDNIWRTEKFLIGGREVSGENVKIAPGMNGVLVKVNGGNLPEAKTKRSKSTIVPINIIALNRYGDASSRIAVSQVDEKGACALPKPKAKSNAPTITKISPDKIFTCNPDPKFDVTGTNLKGISEVRLNTVTGTFTTQRDGKALKVSFAGKGRDIRSALGSKIDKPKLVIKTADGTTEKEVSAFFDTSCP